MVQQIFMKELNLEEEEEEFFLHPCRPYLKAPSSLVKEEQQQ